MNYYEAKQEARRERLLARAEKLDRISAARYRNAMAQIEGIPPGQPILVGHHSERGHRAALARHDTNMRKAIEAEKAAGRARAAADSVGSAGISSDDPDAVAKLEAELAEVNARQAMMVAVNKVVRAFYKNGNRAEQSDEDLARFFEKMAEAGVPSKVAARQLLTPSWGTHVGFETYQLSNNGATARRIEQRIAHLKRAATREHKEIAIGNTGIRLVQNVEENRLQIIFPGKPAADVRAKLKSSGFRWSPTSGAWQRHLGNSAIYAAETILKEMRE